MIKFEPWIGDNYNEGIDGKKVLVLGESHYCASLSDAHPSMTKEVIRDLFDPDSEFENYKNTYTKFAKSITGNFGKMSVEEKATFWHSVAFYNYVQEPISGPRVAPTEAQFKLSEQAFREVLATLRPDVVIAWGHRLYNHLPGDGHQGAEVHGCDGTAFETWVYPLGGGKTCKVLGIDHPSVGFSPEYWYEVITNFLVMSR